MPAYVSVFLSTVLHAWKLLYVACCWRLNGWIGSSLKWLDSRSKIYLRIHWWCWVMLFFALRASTLLVEHPACQNFRIEWWGVGVVICLEQGADCLHMVQLMPLHPKTPSSLASLKSRLVLLFCYQLTQVVLEKRLLNMCCCWMSDSVAADTGTSNTEKRFSQLFYCLILW